MQSPKGAIDALGDPQEEDGVGRRPSSRILLLF
jgi:hypothetical protein